MIIPFSGVPAHGVTPYYGEANVVYNSNGVDFPVGGQDVYGAVTRRNTGLRRQQVGLQNEECLHGSRVVFFGYVSRRKP